MEKLHPEGPEDTLNVFEQKILRVIRRNLDILLLMKSAFETSYRMAYWVAKYPHVLGETFIKSCTLQVVGLVCCRQLEANWTLDIC